MKILHHLFGKFLPKGACNSPLLRGAPKVWGGRFSYLSRISDETFVVRVTLRIFAVIS